MARIAWLLLAACLAAWPGSGTADPLDGQWIAVPDDVRGAYQALRGMPAFAAAIRRMFPGETQNPQAAEGWAGTYTSAMLSWKRIDLNGDGAAEVMLMVNGAEHCPEDGCPSFLVTEYPGGGAWRVACELRGEFDDGVVRLRARSHGWHHFDFGGPVGWRQGRVRGDAECHRLGPWTPRRRGRIGNPHALQDFPRGASSHLSAAAAADTPYAAVLRGIGPEHVGTPRRPEDWRRRFDPMLHLRWRTVLLGAGDAHVLLLASPALCRDGRCPLVITGTGGPLCMHDAPWDADFTALPDQESGSRRLRIGDRVIGWRAAPDAPFGVACHVAAAPG